MGVPFQELTTVATYPPNMKCLVLLSLLLVSMANAQDSDISQQEIDDLNGALQTLSPGFTRVCDKGETPRGFEGSPRGKRQVGQGPPPCWSVVDPAFDKNQCESQFGQTCSRTKPYVKKGQAAMCISFPAAGDKWFVLKGTYGWCGADECCAFHPKRTDQCNPIRPFPEFFPLPSQYASCADVPNPDSLGVKGAELMKGTEDSQRTVCIKSTETGEWNNEAVTLNDCGGYGCCRFKFVNDQ